MEIGVNTFGIGKELRKDFFLTLKSLKDSGVTSIEPIINFNQQIRRNKLFRYLDSRRPYFSGIFSIDDAEKKISGIRSSGLIVESIHLNNISFDDRSIEEIIGFMKKNKIKYGVFSPLEKNLENNIIKSKDYKRVDARFKENSLTFLIHNHHHEFVESDGITPIEYFLKNDVTHLELDIGWAFYQNLDVVSFIDKYADKIEIIHIKDIMSKEKKRKKLCTEAGKGILPLKDILETTKKYPHLKYILDQDDSIGGDALLDIRNGIKFVKEIL